MNRFLLNKATSSSDEPTPGYIYNEIYQMTFCSKESLTLVGDFLMKKLQRTDLNVKLKTLKVLKHLCENKRLDIRNYLKKKIDVIKECQTCNIVNDELKGETLSMAVRKEASELIKLIYSFDTIETSPKPIVTENEGIKKNRIEGFGNTVYEKKNPYLKKEKLLLSYNIRDANSKGGIAQNSINNLNNFSNVNRIEEQKRFEEPKGSYHSNNTNLLCNQTYNTGGKLGISSRNKMTGFGNPLFNQHPVQKTTGEVAMKYLNDVANKYIPSTFVNKIEKVSAQITKNYANGSLNLQNIINMNGLNDNKKKFSGFDRNKKSLQCDKNNYNYSSTNVHGTKKKEKKKKPTESEVAGTYEKKVVDDVLDTSGAVKKVPTESMLIEFAQKCETLDTKLIVSILTDKLKKKFINEEENWKHKFKVLCVIEYLLIYKKGKEKENTIETLESLTHNLKFQTLEELYRCKNLKQLKKKVNEIFVLLGLQQKADTNVKKNEKRQEGDERKVQKHIEENKIEIHDLLDIDDIDLNTQNKNTTTKGKEEFSFTFENQPQNNMNSKNNICEAFIDTNSAHAEKITKSKNNNLLNILKDDEIQKKENAFDGKKKSCEDFFSYNTDFVSANKEAKDNELFSSLTVKTLPMKVENRNSTTSIQNNELDLTYLNNSFLKENNACDLNEAINYKLNNNDVISMENPINYQFNNIKNTSSIDAKVSHVNDIPNFFTFDEKEGLDETIIGNNKQIPTNSLEKPQNDLEKLDMVGYRNNEYNEPVDMYFTSSLNKENKANDDLHLIDINCFNDNDEREKKKMVESNTGSDILLLNKLLIDNSKNVNFNFDTSETLTNNDHKNKNVTINKEVHNLDTEEKSNENDNTLDEILHSFKLSHKKEETFNKKDNNVNIDAFEILSSHMKL